jgi:lipoprotein-anchoring transpeptidase ErfK/SrfK
MASGRYRLAAVVAFLIVAGTTAAGWHGIRSGGTSSARNAATQAKAGQPVAPARTSPAAARSTSPSLADQATRPLTALAMASPSASPVATASSPAPGAAARKACPAAAAACVDLTDHLTWLQNRGHITYGPIAMEPGTPGTSDATPRGTFHVTWKAGPDYMSNEYNEPMPWAVFFINGVAFHGGSLVKHSHGCVHLALANAKYYHDHLAVGAEVVVFLAAAETSAAATSVGG